MPPEDLNRLKIDKTEKVSTPARRKKRLFISTVILLVLVTGFLYIAGIISPAVSVDVATVSQVHPSQSVSLLNASGYIVAQRKAAVASKVTGRLVALMVEEGSKVSKGQVIARLENEDVTASKNQVLANLNTYRSALEQAKVEMGNSKQEYHRYQKLVVQGFVSQSEFDASETRYRRAVAAVNAAEATVKAGTAALQGAGVAIEYTLIRAPFDAVVLTKNADVGDIITPLGAAANAKAAVVTIADMSSLQVEVDVSETNIASLKVGQPCEIQLDALPDIRFRGEIHAIVPTVDRNKATVLVKVRFLDKDPRMLPDMSAKVSFLSRTLKPEEQVPRLATSQTSLFTNGNEQLVYLVHGNRVKKVPVTVGMKLGDMIEILSGLKPGDQVVLRPSKGLKEGTKVKITGTSS